MKPRPDRRRPEPYYKVQHRDRVTLAWKDLRKEAFATLEAAREFVEASTSTGPMRIVEFNAGRSTIVREQS
jgi:hypothetical protein